MEVVGSLLDKKMVAQFSLLKLLKEAYSGELAAALAYGGHARAVSSEVERAEILKIADEELHHRTRLGDMIEELGGEIDLKLERKMTVIGTIISTFCFWSWWVPGSWFISMYGAGRLESHNIGEYEEAARLALLAGHDEFVSELLTFAEVEWDHEYYFRLKARDSLFSRIVPLWEKPQLRSSIRASFEEFSLREDVLKQNLEK